MDGRIDIAPLGAQHERSNEVSKRDSNPRKPAPQAPTPELVLAAIERAALHRAKANAAVPAWAIAEHLGISLRSAAARQARSQLEALVAAGSLQRGRQHGVPMWSLTAAGRDRLRRAGAAGELPPLPESPQHRAWHAARTAAAQEIGRFAGDLREALEQAARLLESEPPARSDDWFTVGERLQRAAWRLGSAQYCLREWVEPQDERADLDDHRDAGDQQLDSDERERRRARRLGRRNVRLWEPPRG